MKLPKRQLLTASLALGFAAVGSAVHAADTITLGTSLQLSGPLANTGRSYRDAYQFAVDKINEKGGITIGNKIYKFALKLVDNKSDLNLGVKQQTDLAAKKRVNYLLGPFASNHVMATSAIAEKYQMPMIQAGGASSRIFSRGFKYVFGTLPVADDYFRSTIEMLGQLTPKPKTVGLISGDDAFDTSLSGGTTALLKASGLQVVLDQQYSERIPNFYNILTLVQSRSPDVILWSGHEAGAIDFIRMAKSRDISPKLMASFTVGVPSASFRNALRADANYAFGMTPWLPSERLKDQWFGDAKAFASAYEAKFRYPPDYHAAAAVAAVESFAKALQAAGTLEPLNVRDAIAKLDFESIYGRVRFGEDGQIKLPQTVIQIQDGQIVEIFTDKVVNPPLYPVPPWDKRL
jgi:branched-chain amino acid transport system substrate-binding protein